jgi:hypothetical protein
MAAWTLPKRITDWCEFLTTALDRRSRKYFVTVILRYGPKSEAGDGDRRWCLREVVVQLTKHRRWPDFRYQIRTNPVQLRRRFF